MGTIHRVHRGDAIELSGPYGKIRYTAEEVAAALLPPAIDEELAGEEAPEGLGEADGTRPESPASIDEDDEVDGTFDESADDLGIDPIR